jgi:hypothetical protein
MTVDELAAALQVRENQRTRVLALHHEIHWAVASHCAACGTYYPCATVRALTDLIEGEPTT